MPSPNNLSRFSSGERYSTAGMEVGSLPMTLRMTEMSASAVFALKGERFARMFLCFITSGLMLPSAWYGSLRRNETASGEIKALNGTASFVRQRSGFFSSPFARMAPATTRDVTSSQSDFSGNPYNRALTVR